MRDFHGKTVLVTGSTKGIGRQTALQFAAEGANVVVTGRTVEAGEKVVAEIAEAGGSATFVQADLSDQAQVEALVGAAVDHFGGLHVLVNNAAPIDAASEMEKPLADQTAAEFDSILGITLVAPVTAMRAAIPELIKAGGGAIVNVSSAASVQAIKGLPAYTAAKGGLNALTRQVAADYGHQGVRCNAVIVGTIPTEFSSGVLLHPAVKSAFAEILLTPGGEMGEPSDIAEAVVWLASDATKYMNGSFVTVDAGMTAQSIFPDVSKVWEQWERSNAANAPA